MCFWLGMRRPARGIKVAPHCLSREGKEADRHPAPDAPTGPVMDRLSNCNEICLCVTLRIVFRQYNADLPQLLAQGDIGRLVIVATRDREDIFPSSDALLHIDRQEQ